VRVDPVAGRVTGGFGVGGYPFGLAYGAGSVWVGSRFSARVTRVKATTNRRQARIRVGSAPYALAFGAGSVWVSNEGSGAVSRIGPRRNKVIKTIRFGGRPNGIAFAFRMVWVADFGRGRLIRIDPRRNRVQRKISIPTADWITASPDSLWVSSETGRIYRVDPATMAVEATVSVGANPLASAWIDGKLGCRTSTRAPSPWSIQRPTPSSAPSPWGRARSRSPRRRRGLGHFGDGRRSLAARDVLTERQRRSAFGSRKPSDSSGSAGRPPTSK